MPRRAKDWPRYMRPKPLASGQMAYFWTLPTWAQPKKMPDGSLQPVIRHGKPCHLESRPLGTDLPAAWQKAEETNAAFDAWRKGEDHGKQLIRGSVSWLFAWFRKRPEYAKKIKNKTRADYRKIMDVMEAYPMKSGGTLGDRMASKVDAPLVDKLYARLQEKRGKRQATYCMQVCRRIWGLASRPGYDRITGVTSNPFAKMGLSSTAKKGNRETTRPEYNLYRKTAREMGFQSMATAAAIAFELVNRTWDVFGFADDEGHETVGAIWAGYRPGHSFTLTLSKSSNSDEPIIKTIPLIDIDPVDKTVIQLYPVLEEELARTPRSHDRIVVEERNGQPYTERRMSTVHRKICEKAGLPKEMTFTGFRHGGATELGDMGEGDIRPISGHKKLETTAIYKKASQAAAVRIGRSRLRHIAENVVMEDDNES